MMVSMPMLVAECVGIGIVAGYFVGVGMMDIPAPYYLHYMEKFTGLRDIKMALCKGFVFAVLIVFVSCHQGLNAKEGAVGVGRAPTEAVVIGSLSIDPPKVSARLMETATPDNTHVVISLSKQRAYLFVGEEIAIDSPISSGKRAGMTPSGKFTVLEKDPNHHSSVYGNFLDRSGRVVRAGVSLKIDSAPSGTHYEGAPMKWFMRLTNDGVGMHIGILPGYPASHGCVRMPADIAPMFYQKVKVGTPVEIGA